MRELIAFIQGMPKAELHVHIEGTLEPEMKLGLSERSGVKLPYDSVQAVRDAYDFNDLPSFLAVYYEGMSVLLTEADFYDVTCAYLQKARSQLIMCFLRDMSAEFAMATLLQSLPYREWIIGVGLASDERDNPPVKSGLVRLAENASKGAWLPRPVKETYLAEFASYAL